jgi:hypothetical protein
VPKKRSKTTAARRPKKLTAAHYRKRLVAFLRDVEGCDAILEKLDSGHHDSVEIKIAHERSFWRYDNPQGFNGSDAFYPLLLKAQYRPSVLIGYFLQRAKDEGIKLPTDPALKLGLVERTVFHLTRAVRTASILAIDAAIERAFISVSWAKTANAQSEAKKKFIPRLSELFSARKQNKRGHPTVHSPEVRLRINKIFDRVRADLAKRKQPHGSKIVASKVVEFWNARNRHPDDRLTVGSILYLVR